MRRIPESPDLHRHYGTRKHPKLRFRLGFLGLLIHEERRVNLQYSSGA